MPMETMCLYEYRVHRNENMTRNIMDKQTMNQEIKINSMSDKRDYENTFYEKLKKCDKILYLTFDILGVSDILCPTVVHTPDERQGKDRCSPRLSYLSVGFDTRCHPHSGHP